MLLPIFSNAQVSVLDIIPRSLRRLPREMWRIRAERGGTGVGSGISDVNPLEGKLL